MEKMITYQIKGLVKEYPGFTLKIDDLTLYRGNLLPAGPKRGRKTTLLRILNFLEEPTARSVLRRRKVYKGKL